MLENARLWLSIFHFLPQEEAADAPTKSPRDGYTERERERESEASGKSFGQ